MKNKSISELINKKKEQLYQKKSTNSRSSQRRCSVRKGALGNFGKFTGKQLCQSLFLIKLQAYFIKISRLIYCRLNFIKKETLTQVFSCKFSEISKKIFFTEHLWTTASVNKFLLLFFQELDLPYQSLNSYFEFLI